MHLRTWSLLTGLVIVSVLSVCGALAFGSANLSLGEVASALIAGDGVSSHELIVEIRLERAANAYAVGALLALAGLAMQVLLRNPLADPYVLGTSGGAAVAALISTLAGFGSIWVDVSAFVGAMAATGLVFVVARAGSVLSPERLLLTGIVLASGFAAAISVLLALAPEQGIKGMLFWLMGDFSFARNPAPVWTVLVVAAGFALVGARNLNLLARGELQASILGLNVKRTQALLFVLSALLTAVAVSTAGPIGFVGLVIPHFVRLALGSDHRRVIPASLLAGGSLMVGADVTARTIVAPLQLPVGALTAFIGVPAFLFLMQRKALVHLAHHDE